MYAQKLEGDSWIGERMDPGKIEKMSGEFCWVDLSRGSRGLTDGQISSWDKFMNLCRRFERENWKRMIPRINEEAYIACLVRIRDGFLN
jgi:hypothetical protein